MYQLNKGKVFQNNDELYTQFCKASDFIYRLNDLLSLNKKILDENYLKEQKRFFIKYSKDIMLKRFSIAIFGKISSGKSTFLNYFLGLKDILEMKSDITTKFICFIRHNKRNEVPKFYEVLPENRIISNENCYFFNFKKGNEIKGNINEIISERNKEISEIERKEEIIQERLKYFIIIEANLTLFNDPVLEKYANIFEFLDIPGLDEGEFNKNIYIKNLIPIIMPNLAFSIFLFNSDSMEDISSEKIIKKITNYFTENKIFIDENISREIDKNIALNSLYIINKVDDELDYDIKRNILKKKLQQIYTREKHIYNINQLNIIPLSARNLLFEKNEYDDFYYFLGNVFIKYKKINEKIRKEFKSYLSYELRELSNNKQKKEVEDDDDSSESDSSEANDEENNENEINRLGQNNKKRIEELIFDIKKICINFSMKDYIKFKKKFIPKNKKEKKQNFSNELYRIIHKIMAGIIDKFIKINEFENLYRFMSKENDNCKLSQLSKDIIINYECIRDPISILNEAENKYKEELLKIDMRIGKKVLEMSEYKKNIFNNQNKLYYLLLGKSNSGKSTFINTAIIGYDILPMANRECTKIGIILKHCDRIEESALYKVNLKTYQNDESEDFYFDYNEEKPISKGKENIKKELIKFNKTIRYNDIDFYLIKIPLQIFEFIDNEEIRELRHIIHFIDFPGLDTSTMEKANKTKSKLLKSIHGFIFINRTDISQINDDSTNNLINDILEDIRKRELFEFSFKSCLFVMISEENKEIEAFRKELNICINKIQLRIPSSELLKNYNSEVKNEDIQVVQFSNIYFKKYLSDYELLLDQKSFLKQLSELRSQEEVEKYYDFLKAKVELPKDFKLPKEKEDLKEIILNNLTKNVAEKKRNKFAEKIAKYYYYIINNPTSLCCYNESGFENMKYYLTNILLNSMKFYQKSLKQSMAKHLGKICESFIQIKNAIYLETKNIDVDYFANNENIELKFLSDLKEETETKLNDIFGECENEIMKSLASLNNNLNNFRNDFEKKENAMIEESIRIYNLKLKKINEAIKQMMTKIQAKIIFIKSHASKRNILNANLEDYQLKSNNLKVKGKAVMNFLEKSYEIPAMQVTVFIPYVNLIAFAIPLFGGIIDFMRDHSEEFKEEINRIKNIFKFDIKRKLKNTLEYVNKIYITQKEQIKDLFKINGYDLQKIQKNKKQLIIIIDNFEKFLTELLSAYLKNDK